MFSGLIDRIIRLRKDQEIFEDEKKMYTALLAKLDDLPKTMNPKLLVPFGDHAFKEGHVEHSNEVLVLLGDNIFAWRTTHQAKQIISRRLLRIESNMAQASRLEKEALSELRFIDGQLEGDTTDNGDTMGDGEGFVEIREPIDDDDEEKTIPMQVKPPVENVKVETTATTTTGQKKMSKFAREKMQRGGE